MRPKTDMIGLPAVIVHEIRIFLILFNPSGLIIRREIEEREKLFSVIVTANSKNLVIPGLDCPDIGLRIKNAVRSTDLLHPAKRLVNLTLTGIRIAAKLGLVPVKSSAVQIPAVHLLDRIFMVRIIIPLPDLIAAVKNRNAALGHQERVKHEIEPDRQIQLPGIVLILGRLDPAE